MQKYVGDFTLAEGSTADEVMEAVKKVLQSVPHYGGQEYLFMKPVKSGQARNAPKKLCPIIPHVKLDFKGLRE
jgi:hypothetical protein